MSLSVRAAAGGAAFAVKVMPGAGCNRAAGEWQGALKVKIGKKPVQGAANLELLRWLAEQLAVPRRDVRLLAGDHARLKQIAVAGLTPVQVRERLESIMTGGNE